MNRGRILPALILLMVFNPLKALGDELSIEVSEVNVYREASDDSDVIATLQNGDSVPVSKKTYDGFYKVLLQEGRKRVGYIKISDLRGGKGKKATTARRTKSRKRPLNYYGGRTGVGLLFGMNYSNQGSRRIEDPQAAPVDISSSAGMAPQYGFFVDFPLGQTMGVRGYLLIKQVKVSGSATIQSGSNPRPVDLYVSETFLSVGGTWKYYGAGRSATWWGGGAQVDKATSAEIKYGNATTRPDTDLPTFVNMYGAAGIDFMTGNNFAILPEIRLGAVVNSKPMTWEVDLNLAVAYVF